MKNQSTYFDNYKIFGISILGVYSLVLSLYTLAEICSEFDGYVFYYLYDVLVYVTGIIGFITAMFSVIWFFIAVIWCIVIAKKDKNPKVFLHPLVFTNIFLTIFYPLGWIVYFMF